MTELDAAIAEADPRERAGLVVQLAARLAVLGAGLVSGVSPAPAEADQNLSVKEAAARLGVSGRYVYNHAAELGGIRFGRRLVIPARALAQGRR
jgi:excisionase family DNA binding protein